MKKYISIASLLIMLVIAAGCASPLIVVNWLPTNTPTLLPTPATSLQPTTTFTETATVPPDSHAVVDSTLTPTPTSLYTFTSTPTFTPIVSTPQIHEAILKNYEWFLSGPGNEYFHIYPYRKGKMFRVLGISEDKKWFLIELANYENGGTGWAPIGSFGYDFDEQNLLVIPNPPTPSPARTTPNPGPFPKPRPVPTTPTIPPLPTQKPGSTLPAAPPLQ